MRSRIPDNPCSYNFARSFAFCCLCLLFTGKALAENPLPDDFVPPADNKYDWIQLTSGEWLKGELKVLYNYKLEFDSDELDLLTFDLEDVYRIRTHSYFGVRIDGEATGAGPGLYYGYLSMTGNKVIVTAGDQSVEFQRSQLVSIAQSGKKERDLWSGDISLGTNVKGGNTQSIDFTVTATVKRRVASSRIVLDYIGNYTEADYTETSNNHRLSGYRDTFLSKKVFWRQIFAEYYRDPFKNLDNQSSLATSLGYHLIYTSKTEWDISAGLGARYTKYVSVEPGENSDITSPALGAGTKYDTELTKAIDLLVDYNFQIVDKDAGRYTHHFVTAVSTDLIGDVDLDISFIWDRIQDPQVDSDNVVPDKNDYQLVVGLGLEF